MNTIHSSTKRDPGDELASAEIIQESTNPYGQELNITDGGEFLDDRIRMKDQPFGETITKPTK